MSSRTKKVIGVIVAIIILLLLALLLWLLSQRPETAPINLGNQPTNQTQPLGTLNTTGGGGARPPVTDATEEPAQPDSEVPDQRANLRSLAAAFAERYGSYSNQGNFENLEEVRALMTDALAAQTAKYIDGARAEDSSSAVYVGMTTRSMGAKVSLINEDQGTATVAVNTQREEITAEGSRVFYQELILSFVREGEIWKVSAAEWADNGG